MKRFIAVLATLLLCVSCSATKVTDPTLKPHASGTPQEGGGGEEGGGGGGMTVNLGDTYGAEVSDEFNIPIHINGVPGETKGYQVTVTVSSGVTITGASAGAFILDNDPNAFGWSGSNMPYANSYTIVWTLGPGHCNSTSFGTLFYVRCRFDEEGEKHVTLVASPEGAVTPSPYVTNCSNQSQSVTYGNTNTTINVVNP